jgi:hypothetical protein
MKKHFNEIYVSQSRTHISSSTKTYLHTVFAKYAWDIAPMLLPMNPSNECVLALEDALSLDPTEHSHTDNARFHYRATIVKIVWLMITTCPKLSYPIINVSQSSSSTAVIHYDTIYGIFKYISGTRNDGLTYTWKVPTSWGPVITYVPLCSQPTGRSISGMVLFL